MKRIPVQLFHKDPETGSVPLKDLDRSAPAVAKIKHTAGVWVEVEFQFDDCSQSITTHNTLLMESDIPKESIYTIYETENGSKKIECITQRPDNKIQKNTNIRKQYLAGGYRGIPKKIHIDFNQLLKTLKKDSMG